MQEKKPVYNGYEELYLSGAELKELFKDHYYATGRHHSVILGISIPDFLEMKGISDSKEYRIFINKFFCRVMNANTDGLIVFFGHNELGSIKSTVDVKTIQLAKTCPVCGAPMKFKEGKYGDFLGCSRYPGCKQTAKIPIIGKC